MNLPLVFCSAAWKKRRIKQINNLSILQVIPNNYRAAGLTFCRNCLHKSGIHFTLGLENVSLTPCDRNVGMGTSDWSQKQMPKGQCKEWQERAAAPSRHPACPLLRLRGFLHPHCVCEPSSTQHNSFLWLCPQNPFESTHTISSHRRPGYFLICSESIHLFFFFLMMPDFYTRKGRRRMQSSENEPPAPAGTAAGPCGWGMATGGRCGARWAWAVQSPGTALGQGFCGHSLSQARDNHHLCQAHSATSEAAASVPTLTFKRGQLQQEYEQTFFWAPSFFFFSSCFFFFFSSIKCSSSCVSCSFSLIKTKVRKSFSVRWSFSRKVNNPYLHC